MTFDGYSDMNGEAYPNPEKFRGGEPPVIDEGSLPGDSVAGEFFLDFEDEY